MEKYASEFKILIVDDVKTNIMLVQAILKKEGYTLLICDSGKEALRLAGEQHPDLILLDIMMPEMDGYEVLKHLKSNPETNHIPVIIMSALSDMPSIVKGYQLGAIEYVTKPFQREELLKRVSHRFELFSIKRIKADLEHTIELRDTLYSVIAQDLRSPIGSLRMMNTSLLAQVDPGMVGIETYETLQLMNKTTNELFLHLDNLLKWAKHQISQQPIFLKELDINGIIQLTIEMYQPLAMQKGIKLTSSHSSDSLLGWADIDMFNTILRNLISNALKFTPSGGNIIVSARQEHENIVCCVKDSGKGITPEEQTKLLRTDVRYTTFGTQAEKGLGLGLSLCKNLVEQHEGRIWIESEGEGKGSSFYFTIPALPRQELSKIKEQRGNSRQ